MKLGFGVARAAVVLALLVPAAARAQWLPNGAAVCTAINTQELISITGNGLGGTTLVWTDYRAPNGDIYARQVDSYGVNQWTPDGIALCTAGGLQWLPKVLHDGQGYLFYVWEDQRTGGSDVYAAVTDRLGNIFTGGNGFPICTAVGNQQGITADADPAWGFIYTAWYDPRSGNNDIYMAGYGQGPGFEGITTEGDGVALCTLPSDQVWPTVAATGGLTSVVAWQDFRNGSNYDIYAQRVDWEGVQYWAGNGVPVCTNAGGQTNPIAISDGADGAIILWNDFRNGTSDLYVQKINGSGVPQWTAGGVAVRVAADITVLPNIISDGAGGAIISWQDERNSGSTGPDIYTQHIASNGVAQWAANGIPVCTALYAQSSCRAATDGVGGVIITWQDVRTLGPADVYAQRIDQFGNEQWTTDGLLISGATGNQYNPKIAYDGTGACVIAWEDNRSGNVNVYAHRVSKYGDQGHPEPTITSVSDVPGDSGGMLRVVWSPGDAAAVNFYQLYRSTDQVNWTMVLNASGNGGASYTDDVPSTADGVLNYFYVTEYTLGYDPYDSNIKSGTSLANPTGVGDTPTLPKALALLPNSPNPFEASTQLHIGLPAESDVRMEVFNVAGERVASRDLGRFGAGWRSVDFDGRDNRGTALTSGVYFYRVTANGQTTTHKMVIGR